MKPDDNPASILEQIRKLSRDFGKHISQGRSPRIQKFLSQISEEGRADLFSNLLGIETNYRRSRGESPTSDEYVKRFPQFKKQVRLAFFEPTMGSVDSSANTDGDDQTASLRSPRRDADALEPTFELPDANRVGDYELIRKLGQGGMGIVYEAQHTKTNNRVALKTLLTGGDGQQINAEKLYRFRKEFRRLSEINHPNLAGMQSLEVDGDRWFFTMDLIDGEDFLSYVRPDDHVDEERLRSCLKQLATGVLELHRRGIIHRDLKPSNVLVSREGHVTILDFGLAAQLQRNADMTQTKSGMFAGTPPYAAPEQMFGERTEASDWYAFGTMLFEALTGERPFLDPDPMKLLRMKQEQDPPELSYRDGLPSDLSSLADGLLCREPGLRLLSDAIGTAIGLEEETRIPGSTRGSQGSAGSANAEDAELEEFEEEEIVLIGREKQLAQLEEIKQEFLESRQPHVVWITGLSGEGKSSLVEAFLRPLRKVDEMLVLSGRCYDRESVPFKAIDCFIDPLVSFLRSRSQEELNRFIPDDFVAVAHLFPLIRRIRSVSNRDFRKLSGLDDRQIHNLAFFALKELLTNISKEYPIFVFVDDLQWGDADSAEAIFKQLISVEPPEMLVLGSFRRDEMDQSPFWKAWEHCDDMQSESISSNRIEVRPLSPQQAIELLALRTGMSPIDLEKQAGELIQDSHGNPYFLEQLIEGLDLITGMFRAVPLPEIISSKLQRLPVASVAILDAISIAGKAVSLDELLLVCGLEGSAFSTVAHMRSERLVRLVGSADERMVDTYHDKIRESVTSSIGNAEKQKIHLRFAVFLEQKFEAGEDCLFDLALHSREASYGSAFRYQLLAGESALRAFAFENALEYLASAEQLADPDLSSEDRFRLESMIAKSLAGCDRLNDAVDRFVSALPHASEAIDKASCYFALSEIYWRNSKYQQAFEYIRQSFAELGERLPLTISGKLFFGFTSLLQFHLFPAWIPAGKIRLSDDEVSLLQRLYSYCTFVSTQLDVYLFIFLVYRNCVVAKRVNSPAAKSEAYSNYASVLSFSGLAWPSNAMMASARKAYEKSTSRDGFFEYRSGVFSYSRGKLDDAEFALKQALVLQERTGNYQRIFTHHFLWHVYSVHGRAGLLIENAKKEGEIAGKSNDRVLLAYSAYGQAQGYAMQGSCRRAAILADNAVSVLDQLNGSFLCVAEIQRARVKLMASEYEEAVNSLHHAIKEIPKLRLFEITSPAFGLMVEAKLGERWALKSKLEWKTVWSCKSHSCVARFLGWFFPNIRANALRVAGRLAFSRGRIRRATRFFDKAIGKATAIGANYEHARALIDKSLLGYPAAKSDREKGLSMLESLGCVLPEAEVEYLGLDRDSHHARAAEARAKHETELQR